MNKTKIILKAKIFFKNNEILNFWIRGGLQYATSMPGEPYLFLEFTRKINKIANPV